MDQIRSGSILVTWEAERRLAVLRYEAKISAQGKDVLPVLEELTRWVGSDGETFFLLNDCGPLIYMDAAYRAAWREFFRPHRDDSWVALYNLSPVFRVIAEMFRVAAGIRISVFANEGEARSWLCEMGCPP